jgi:CelD/BcsL family acetyltransferase involved in cellulose biosynthesis
MEPALEHLSQWMMESAVGHHGDENRWQRLDLESVATDDLASNLLCQKLVALGAQCVSSQSATCWRINLCDTQNEWLSRLNKSIRRKLRLLQTRAIQTGRAIYKVAATQSERATIFKHLVRLHNDRRNQLGELGCFEFPGFFDFLNQIVERPESGDMVKLSLVELDGIVVAAGLCFESENGLMVYQTGISMPSKSNADFVAANPGWLLNLFHIDYARQRGLSYIDYLRGNEKYKRQLGALPVMVNFHMVVPPVAGAVIRQKIWSMAQVAKGFGKEVIQVLPQL